MAGKSQLVLTNNLSQPNWPTTVRGRLPGGRVLGTDGSMWAYWAVPLEPVSDAKTLLASLGPAEPILSMFEELSSMASVKIARRSAAKGSYRRVHMLLINVPDSYHLTGNDSLARYLNTEFADAEVQRRLLLFGVRLKASVGGGGGMRAAIDSVVETLVMASTPVSDFDQDFKMVSDAATRAGMRAPTDEEFRLAETWWSVNRNPSTAMVAHPGHLHIFDTIDAAQTAERSGAEDCSTWPEIDDQYVLTMAAMQSLTLPFSSAAAPGARWADLLRHQGALAVSIRGLVEPAKVTRAELRKRRKQYTDDIEERYKNGKMERAEQESLLDELTAVEAAYAEGGPPTLVDTAVTIALNGPHKDLYRNSDISSYTLTEMAYRQSAAIGETWLASPILANPHLHDIPVHSIAYSGLPALSRVGDRTGAQLGLTQRDAQPSFISHIAASRGDSLPLLGVWGATGSGKTIVLLWIAHQWAKNRVPQVIFDPKPNSDLSAAVMASGGRVASLDSIISADGVLDPMRFADSPILGIEPTAAMIMSVNPWGSKADDYYTPLMKALKTGINKGAVCTGQAMKLALEEGAPREVIQPVLDLADTSPAFRACVGMNPDAPGLRVSDGITMIKVGNNPLNLPPAGMDRKLMTPPQRAALNLIRQVTVGAMKALSGRDGVLHLDEAWTVLGSGQAEMEEIGRLARSMRVLPILYTQRCTDALNAGLTGYISRTIILPISDPDEAKAACLLAGLEPTPERMAAITARARVGDAPNWASMRALRDPSTGDVLRGTIGIYSDLDDRSIPVEVRIPKSFLDLASTNPDDIERRLKEQGQQIEASILY